MRPVGRSVVTRENDQRFLSEAKAIHRIGDPTDLPVQFLKHGKELLLVRIIGNVLVLRPELLLGQMRIVHVVGKQLDIEGPIPVLALLHERDRAVNIVLGGFVLGHGLDPAATELAALLAQTVAGKEDPVAQAFEADQ